MQKGNCSLRLLFLIGKQVGIDQNLLDLWYPKKHLFGTEINIVMSTNVLVVNSSDLHALCDGLTGVLVTLRENCCIVDNNIHVSVLWNEFSCLVDRPSQLYEKKFTACMLKFTSYLHFEPRDIVVSNDIREVLVSQSYKIIKLWTLLNIIDNLLEEQSCMTLCKSFFNHLEVILTLFKGCIALNMNLIFSSVKFLLHNLYWWLFGKLRTFPFIHKDDVLTSVW